MHRWKTTAEDGSNLLERMWPIVAAYLHDFQRGLPHCWQEQDIDLEHVPAIKLLCESLYKTLTLHESVRGQRTEHGRSSSSKSELPSVPRYMPSRALQLLVDGPYDLRRDLS